MELLGGTLASVVSYMFSEYAQISIDENMDNYIVSDKTMRVALASVLWIPVLLTLFLARCMFKEMPIERR